MDPILIISILLVGSTGLWIGIYCYKNKRKFYRNYASKLSGEVVSWSIHNESNEVYTETYYDIDVLAENGQIYQLSTNCNKALKYKNKRDIVIMVPDSIQNIEDYTYADNPKKLIKIEEEIESSVELRVPVVMGIVLTLLTIVVTVAFISNYLK